MALEVDTWDVPDTGGGSPIILSKHIGELKINIRHKPKKTRDLKHQREEGETEKS